LRFGQAVDLAIETHADTANGAKVGVDGLRLHALPLDVLEMGLVLPLKVGFRCRVGCGGHGGFLANGCTITVSDIGE